MTTRRLYQNRALVLAVSSVGSFQLDATPGLVPANDTTPEPVPELKWINVANEGAYRGHSQGEFALTPEVLQQLVTNFHASPKFKLGEVTLDGQTRQLGVKGVVQYDYEHASEMAPWEGSIPTSGAPAIGWVHDLELRQDAEGRTQLWALSWLSEQVREQIRNRGYDSVSIAWNPNGVHWVTGEPIGAVLTSIAFTNHPFLQDLESLAARELRGARRASAPGGRAAGQPPGGSVQPRARSVEAPAGTGSNVRERSSMQAPNRARLCSLFGLIEQADDQVIIRAAENANSAGGNLAALMQALGFQGDPKAALEGVAALREMEKQLQSALAELAALQQGDAAMDEQQVEGDVAAAMAARNQVTAQGMVDPVQYGMTKAFRADCIRVELAKLPHDKSGKCTATIAATRDARERGRKTFLETCGVHNDPRTAHLSRTFAAGPGSAGNATQYPVSNLVPLTNAGAPSSPAAPGAPLQLRAPGTQPLTQIDWNMYAGRNLTERVMSYLASQVEGFGELDLATRIARAGEWRRQNAHMMPQQAA